MTRRLAAEALGTALLLVIVVGSGVMGEKLSGGNDAWPCQTARSMPVAEAGAYTVAQTVGAVIGAVSAHMTFGLPLLEFSEPARGSLGEGTGEVIATFGPILTIR